MPSTKPIISELQSKEICDLMNSSHAASLYALALDYVRSRKGGKTKVSFVKMGGSVTLDSFTLSFVECQSGDMCVMNTAKIHFYPPLGSVSDARVRILKESQKAMAPQYIWLLIDPLALLVLSIMLIFGHISFTLQRDGLQSAIDNIPLMPKLVTSIFGSVGALYSAVLASFYFAVVVHVLEAGYASYKLKTHFNLPDETVANWFVLISCVGYPITSKALEFIRIAEEQNSKKQS